MARHASRFLPALALAVIMAASANAMFMRPSAAPIDRLIANTEAYIKEHPKDASGYYTLARIHYLAFWMKKDAVAGMEGDGKSLPSLSSDQMQGGMGGGMRPPLGGGAVVVPKDLTEEQQIAHAKAADENYRKAIDMDPKNASYHLGLASLLEQAASSSAATVALAGSAEGVKPVADQPDLYKALRSTTYKERTDAADKLRAMLPGITPNLVKQMGVETDVEAKKLLANIIGDWARMSAMDQYAQAFDLAVATDLKITNRPLMGLQTLVSYESATQYEELSKDLPAASKADELTKMQTAKKQLEGKRMGPVTPVIFSLEKGKTLADLVSPEVTTTFDLDGTSRGWTWNWVKPDAAILAWDPNHTGKITSGCQLFGNVTFNMLWSDGYRALDALDDNRDGVLSGDELHGLVIWYDRNGNGISDPGEVIPIEQTGIKSIKVHPDTPTSGDAARTPTATNGIVTKSGMALPTWDWIATPRRR